MTEILIDTNRPEVKSAVVYAPFDEAKKLLEDKGYSIISLEEIATLRILEGPLADISKTASRTREGFLYVPGKGSFITKKSPIMQNPVEARREHRAERQYFLTDEQVGQSLEDSVQISEKPENLMIPTDRFGKNEITKYLFGRIAGQYGRFLRRNDVTEMPIWASDAQSILSDRPFARQMNIGNLVPMSDRSGLSGDWDDPKYGDLGRELRGIYKQPEKANRFFAKLPEEIELSGSQIKLGVEKI